MDNRVFLFFGIVALLFSTGTASAQLPRLLLIDEDCLDNSSPAILELALNGLCGGGDPAVCVNDPLANPGVRDPLNLPVGTIIGNGVPGGTVAPLFTGQLFDEAWYLVPTIPQSWVDAGPTADGALNYLLATADGFGLNGEFLLDKIPDVEPLQTEELKALIGEIFCAVNYDSDLSTNFDPQNANLQGGTTGVLALKLLHVGEPNDEVLPDITIEILDPGLCAQGPVQVEPATWGEVKSIYR